MEQIDFVEHYYPYIAKVRNLQDDYHYHTFLDVEGMRVLKDLFPDAMIAPTTHSWASGLAIRYSLNRWPSRSDIVIHASSETGSEGLSVRLYAFGISNDEKLEVHAVSPELEQWTEGSDTRCWKTPRSWQSHCEMLWEFRRLAGKFDEFLRERESDKGMQADARKATRPMPASLECDNHA